MLTNLYIFLFPRRYYNNLCVEFCGNSIEIEEKMEEESGIVKKRLSPFIKKEKANIKNNYNRYLHEKELSEEANLNRCISCPWGNGEGGCTSGDYCPERDGEIYE